MTSSNQRGLEEKMAETGHSVFDFEVETLDGRPMRLSEYSGKVLLIVNTASQCGFTPQYAGLEKLYRKYKDRGLEVLGFPCNQFGGQEPGSPEEIGGFCERNYGVSFPMFGKIEVNGKNAHPLYRYLKNQRRGLLGFWGGGAIRWNFTKFLVDPKGRVVSRYGSITKPEKLAVPIEELLDS